MDKFVKLFEREDSQVVVLLQRNDQDYPEIRFMTMYRDIKLEAAPSFGPNMPDDYYDEELAWDKAENEFNKTDEKRAYAVREALIITFLEQ